MEEIWKDIEGYEGLYQVSNLGRIKSLDRWVKGFGNSRQFIKGKILKKTLEWDGYYSVGLCKNGKKTTTKVHRLVAEAFIPNPDNLPCVNHKDEVKTNNHVGNLEFCSHQYNNNYGTHNERVAKSQSKKVLQYSLDGQFIREWKSLNEIQRQLGLFISNICKCCNGQLKMCYNYKWKYA